jgi:prophage antirepressor-like protein
MSEIKTQLQTFDFKSTPVRALDRAGQPWFVAADVCRVLELSNVTETLRGLDADELSSELLNSDTQGRTMRLISESGLYALIFKSRKPEAKTFRKWVTSEVLPAIRRTGGYAVLTGIGRIQQVLELAIVDLYEGRMSVEKAAAMAGLVGQYYRNGWKLGQASETTHALEVLDAEHREFSSLVAALWRRDQEKEWTSLQMREVALAEGLFAGWLKAKTLQSPAIASRFGLLCDRQCNRAFEGIVFQRHGKNRQRVFTLTQLP